jgi:hypothetical protein
MVGLYGQCKSEEKTPVVINLENEEASQKAFKDIE